MPTTPPATPTSLDQRPASGHGPLPARPCLRRDAVVIAVPGGPVQVRLSTRRTLSVLDAPDGVDAWIAGLDGYHGIDDVLVSAPVPDEQARYVLHELDRAGMLTDAEFGLPFRAAELRDRDALRLAAEVRDGARRPRIAPPAAAAVGVHGRQPWAGLLTAAVTSAAERVRPAANSRSDLLAVIGAPFDTSAQDACDRAAGLGTPHVRITVSAVDALFGPLTIPGVTACSRCCSLHQGEPGDDWRVWSYRGRAPAPPQLPPHHRALVSALALEHILACVDVLQDLVAIDRADRERYLDLRRAEVSVRRIPPHPACGCIRRAA